MTLKDTLDKVNRAVNSNTRYRTDQAKYGQEDVWAVADGQGDCEDFALAKYRQLVSEGVSKDILRLATCIDEVGNAHAVLLADDTENDTTWVLDNRYVDLRPWGELVREGYFFQKVQVAGTSTWENFRKDDGKMTLEVTPLRIPTEEDFEEKKD